MSSLTMDQALAMVPNARRVGGNDYRSRCPAHNGTNPTSLSIREGIDGMAYFTCWSNSCSVKDIVAALGMPPADGTVKKIPREIFDSRPTIMKLWMESEPMYGTLGENYLEARGVNRRVPSTVRFHPELLHPNGNYYPAILAAVCVGTGNNVEGIQRTFLRQDGLWKANVFPPKMRLGAVPGGTIRLGPATRKIILTEGLEDGLTLYQDTLDFDDEATVWVSMGSKNLARAWLPPLPMAETVVVAIDNDTEGELAIEECVREFNSEGREVRILRPHDGHKDFNSRLMALEGLDSHA